MNAWGRIGNISPQESRKVQNTRLHRFLNHYLYPFSLFYRRLLDAHGIDPRRIRTVEDLRHIPLTSKKDFIDPRDPEKFKEFILRPDAASLKASYPKPRLCGLKLRSLVQAPGWFEHRLEEEFRPCFITFTTGTTHSPVPYVYTRHDIANLHLSGARMLDLFSVKSSEYLLNMFPYAPHLAFWQVVFGGLSAHTLILSTGGGKVMGTEGNIAALLKMRPAVIIGVPSFVYHVLRVAREQNCRLDFVRHVVLGAMGVTSAFKKKVAALLEDMGARQVSVFGTYGFTEARTAWAECPSPHNDPSGYHLYPDKEIFEVINPETGEVKGEGEDGELVYTSLDSRGSPVLRFRTGDMVRGGIRHDPCPHCGRSVPRISSDITRLSDVKEFRVTKVKGSLVNLSNFSDVLSSFGEIEEWQIELTKKDNDPYEIDQLAVFVSARQGTRQDDLKEAIRRRLLLKTEVSANRVEFVPLKEMVRRLGLETSGKERRVLDRRPQA